MVNNLEDTMHDLADESLLIIAGLGCKFSDDCYAVSHLSTFT